MTHVFKKSSVCVARHYAPMLGRARAPVGSGLCAVHLAVCGECGERDVGVCGVLTLTLREVYVWLCR